MATTGPQVLLQSKATPIAKYYFLFSTPNHTPSMLYFHGQVQKYPQRESLVKNPHYQALQVYFGKPNAELAKRTFKKLFCTTESVLATTAFHPIASTDKALCGPQNKSRA